MALAAHERAAAMGRTMREYASIASLDSRIGPSIVNDAAGVRTARWDAADRPQPDITRLEFVGDDSVRAIVGDDSVRAIVGDVLFRMPAPVAYYGIEHVVWFEIGRSAIGTACNAPTWRAPSGDRPHMVQLAGVIDDGDLPGVVAHELAHGWCRAVRPVASYGAGVNERELMARDIIAERIIAEHEKRDRDIERLVRESVAEEVRADSLATLWGCRRVTDVARLTQLFRSQYVDAIPLADQLERDIDHEISAATDRIAAIPAGDNR